MGYAEDPQKPLLHAVIQLVRKLDFELTEQRWQSSEYQQLRELEPPSVSNTETKAPGS